MATAEIHEREIDKLAEAGLATDQKLNELREAGLATDERLGALINVVERQISEGRNGKLQSPSSETTSVIPTFKDRLDGKWK